MQCLNQWKFENSVRGKTKDYMVCVASFFTLKHNNHHFNDLQVVVQDGMGLDVVKNVDIVVIHIIVTIKRDRAWLGVLLVTRDACVTQVGSCILCKLDLIGFINTQHYWQIYNKITTKNKTTWVWKEHCNFYKLSQDLRMVFECLNNYQQHCNC